MQIKSPVLDGIHHAFGGEQTVVAQIPLNSTGQGTDARYLAESTLQLRPPRRAKQERKPQQSGKPNEAHVGHPEAPTVTRDQRRTRRFPELNMQHDHGGKRGDNRRPEKDPAPADGHCN